MPFIKQQDKAKPEPFALKLRPEVAEELTKYAEFLESDPSYVGRNACAW
jgi:hypothetical protein